MIAIKNWKRLFRFLIETLKIKVAQQISNIFFSVGFYQLNRLRQAALTKISNVIKN